MAGIPKGLLVLWLAALPLAASLAPAAASPFPSLDATGPRDHPGVWENVPGAPLGAIHSAMLPDGRVMLYAFTETYVFDPKARTFTGPATSHTTLFCSGMALLANGRLLAAGGTKAYDPAQGFLGLRSAEVFDSDKEQWALVAEMAETRWYPTAVTLADGRVAVFSGINGPVQAKRVEVFNPVGQVWEEKGSRALPLFVRGHLMPDGKVLFTSPQNVPTTWDPVTGAFRDGPARPGGWRGGGASVLLDSATGQALVFGGDGGGVGRRTAEVLDPASGAWGFTGSMAYGRVWPDGVLLPNGDVVAIGGEPDGVGAYPAEWWDRATGQWVQVATPRYTRAYHSSALLLPDGSVMEAGPSRTVEVYKPWYFFAGPRPRIALAPPVVAYGEAFPISTPDAATVTRAVMMRMGSVTHSLNTDQRLVEVPITKVPGTSALAALAPALPTVAPPGFYMLFLLDGRGVPSVASIVQLAPGVSMTPL